jgi:RimJ/RimL family protein N-acetyltransferase
VEPLIAAPHSFVTARLRLRRPQVSDAEAVFAYASDPEVARFTDWPVATHVRDTVAATERALEGWDKGNELAWRVTVIPDDTPIGAVGCSIDGDRAELGFVIGRRHWGRGYGTEAARAVFDWLTSMDAIARIDATCDVENDASARVLEKLGFTRAALLPHHRRRPNLAGQPCRDALLYSWVRPHRQA